MPLEIEIDEINTIPVARLSGAILEVDDDTMKNGLDPLYKEGHRCFVVDISKVNFVNSHGLGILIYYHNQMSKEGRQMLVLNTNPDTDAYLPRLFGMTKLNTVLNIVNSEDRIPPGA